jgi:hypothetical protein
MYTPVAEILWRLRTPHTCRLRKFFPRTHPTQLPRAEIFRKNSSMKCEEYSSAPCRGETCGNLQCPRLWILVALSTLWKGLPTHTTRRQNEVGSSDLAWYAPARLLSQRWAGYSSRAPMVALHAGHTSSRSDLPCKLTSSNDLPCKLVRFLYLTTGGLRNPWQRLSKPRAHELGQLQLLPAPTAAIGSSRSMALIPCKIMWMA